MSRANLDVRATQLREQGVPFVRARVVLAERPTSAKAGDEAIIHADGSIEGFVGGTCAETTVRAQSLMLLDTKEPLLLRITPTEEPGQLHRHDGTLSVHNPCLSGGTLEIFLDPVVPPPLVQVHGDGPIAAALVGLAAQLDYLVTAVDRQAIGGALGVIVASHGRDEVETLAAALDAGCPVHRAGRQPPPRRRGAERAGAGASRPGPDRARPGAQPGRAGHRGENGQRDCPVHPGRGGVHPDAFRRPGHSPDGAASNRRPQQPNTAIDPICGMTVAAVETSLHLDHDGTRYYFCGPGCLRAFSANPSAMTEVGHARPDRRS